MWNISSGTSVIYTLNLSDKGYTVPIPDEAMEANAALKQNDCPRNESQKAFLCKNKSEEY